MYVDFYRLRGLPFQLTPDQRFFFDNGPHKRANAYLRFGLSQSEGFVVITGEVGAGKTTLTNYALAQLDSSDRVTARVDTTQLEADDLLRMVAASFGLTRDPTDKAALLCAIREFLLQNYQVGKKTLLFVDEAQNLRHSSLEELRMLSNFQEGERALLQICLVGQSEFKQLLASKNLEQLRQRVISTYHLEPLNSEETGQYIRYRLRQVDWDNDPSFSKESFDLIYQETGGIPRKINLLCNRLLLFGYLENAHRIDRGLVAEVARDLQNEGLPAHNERPESAALEAGPQGTTGSEAMVAEAEGRDFGYLRLARRLSELERQIKSQDEKLDSILDRLGAKPPGAVGFDDREDVLNE